MRRPESDTWCLSRGAFDNNRTTTYGSSNCDPNDQVRIHSHEGQNVSTAPVTAPVAAPTARPSTPARTSSRLRSTIVGIAAVLVGLDAGFFVTWQVSIIVGLGIVDDATYVVAFRAFNATVRSAAFGAIFFGAPIALAAAAFVAERRVRPWLVAALVAVLAGVGVTFGIHVPLNEALASTTAAASDARLTFEVPWNRANLARTLLFLGANVAVVVGLLRARGESDAA